MSGRGDIIDLPLHADEVRVIQHRVERGYASSESPADAFQEMEIEIPLRGEEVEVRTRPVVREEVVVRKVLRERSFPVTESLRREELYIDGEPLADTLDRNRRA